MSMMKGGTHIIKVINMGVQQHYRGECTALSIASEISGYLSRRMCKLSIRITTQCKRFTKDKPQPLIVNLVCYAVPVLREQSSCDQENKNQLRAMHACSVFLVKCTLSAYAYWLAIQHHFR